MSERDTRKLLQDMEGIEKSPEEFEAESTAWDHAVLITDYIGMFRSGAVLRTNIYGLPYATIVEALTTDSEYSDRLRALHAKLTADGLQTVNYTKPKPEELFPEPVGSQTEQHEDMFASPDSDHLRLVYQRHFLEVMYGWGFRDMLHTGVQRYLDQVPDQLSLFTFCGPDGRKSFISQDGYFAAEYNLEPDFKRPISQRGGNNGFMTHYNGQYFEQLSSQIAFLAEHVDRFDFDASDLLGYRPKDMTEAGIASAWGGWTSGSTPEEKVG